MNFTKSRLNFAIAYLYRSHGKESKENIMNKMKQFLIMLTVIAAPFGANAGFVGTSEQAVITVAEVSNMGDDKAVVMRGSIEKHLKKDKYQFVDQTGKIVVEIDGDEWRGIDVTPNDTVLIIGETDKDWFSDTSVDVKTIQKVANDNVKPKK